MSENKHKSPLYLPKLLILSHQLFKIQRSSVYDQNFKRKAAFFTFDLIIWLFFLRKWFKIDYQNSLQLIMN